MYYFTARSNATGRVVRHGTPLRSLDGSFLRSSVNHLRRDDRPTSKIRRGNLQQRIPKRIPRVRPRHSAHRFKVFSRIASLCTNSQRCDDASSSSGHEASDSRRCRRKRNSVALADPGPEVQPVEQQLERLGEGFERIGLLFRSLRRHLDYPWNRHFRSSARNRFEIHRRLVLVF